MDIATPFATEAPGAIARATLIAALSRALDLTEGQPFGHSVRTCWIGMRLARAMDWPEASDDGLFYALLLKDAGCTSNAAQVSHWFGTDDQAAKGDLKWRNWTRYADAARYAMHNARPGARPGERLRQMVQVARRGMAAQRDLVRIRCHRGADVLRELGWVDLAPDAVLHLDEHWDGSGMPHGARGESIPRGARLVLLSQQVEIYHARGGQDAAMDMVRRLRGRWFDPVLADRLVALGRDPAFWQGLAAAGEPESIAALDPAPATLLLDSSDNLERVARTFAEVVDDKSPWTAQHSVRTSAYAGVLASHLGHDDAARRRVEMAAFYHDLGKVGVSNLVLDKPGPLDPPERAAIERHVELTRRILQPLEPLEAIARAAASHHERLDGSGYNLGLEGTEVPADAMIIAAADVFDALTAARPYRGPLDPDEAVAIVARDSGTRLPAEVVQALGESVRSGRLSVGQAAPRMEGGVL